VACGRGEKLTGDGSVDDGAVLELDGDRLVVQLHQKPDELHLGGGREERRRRRRRATGGNRRSSSCSLSRSGRSKTLI
jgi:hypothetical protein